MPISEKAEQEFAKRNEAIRKEYHAGGDIPYGDREARYASIAKKYDLSSSRIQVIVNGYKWTGATKFKDFKSLEGRNKAIQKDWMRISKANTTARRSQLQMELALKYNLSSMTIHTIITEKKNKVSKNE